jgi:hypothetical protein
MADKYQNDHTGVQRYIDESKKIARESIEKEERGPNAQKGMGTIAKWLDDTRNTVRDKLGLNDKDDGTVINKAKGGGLGCGAAMRGFGAVRKK